ncbi:decaprenylphospho-beta-D-ribofuranose 2-oxidase [Kribbella sp. VKM Ac-2571]|uniref:FAD-binding oxidoreductase n=1 Tax=Kribbella sp. VKM Ac-2571 TaxID=2512222 RepID=UPI001061D8A5|nr:FAD-binding oxidoreductase [Kribbella sp. VKM Ac-2571]TDO58852.1 decaprenylphospho-beta-D-ribofuranose 2-oxidase [Kribbella sp. VKM Ac-2571]
MTPDEPSTQSLSGWGRTIQRTAQVRRPAFEGGLIGTVLAEPRITVRGAGKSYGDAALPSDGIVLDLTSFDRIVSFDQGSGVVVVEAGALLKGVIDQTLPVGWTLPVVPGTERITVGGAVAGDVHGKNHPGAGSFGRQVLWIALLKSDGTITQLSAGHDADGFWATIGGMGLTGVILRAAIQLQRVDTGWVIRNRLRTHSLDRTIEAMQALAVRQELDPRRHAIAWLDAHARGPSLGRGIVDEFYGASTSDLPGAVAPFPQRRVGGTRQRRSLPGPGVVSTATIAAASAGRWHFSRSSNSQLVALRSALCPLDRAESWPAAFGRRGVVQYQFAVPRDAVGTIHEVLTFLTDHGLTPALTTLKNFGPGSAGPLSFPMPGWTLAVDLPARWLHHPRTLQPVDKFVAGAGGRIYLAKDAVTDPELIPVMYPRLRTWQLTQRRLDPAARWTSALGTRLGLVA